MVRVKPIWQALGVLLVASLAGLAASHWPQQTQAIAASLGFIATVVLLYITKNYVAENQKMRRLMEEQWHEERRVHASFWLQVDPSRRPLIISSHPGGAGGILAPRIGLHIWNSGRHAFRVIRIHMGVPERHGTRKVEMNTIVGAENSQDIDITDKLLKLMAGSESLTLDNVSPRSEDVEVSLDYEGVAQIHASTVPRKFHITTHAEPREFTVLVSEVLQ
jgi:hypothetical protein